MFSQQSSIDKHRRKYCTCFTIVSQILVYRSPCFCLRIIRREKYFEVLICSWWFTAGVNPFQPLLGAAGVFPGPFPFWQPFQQPFQQPPAAAPAGNTRQQAGETAQQPSSTGRQEYWYCYIVLPGTCSLNKDVGLHALQLPVLAVPRLIKVTNMN